VNMFRLALAACVASVTLVASAVAAPSSGEAQIRALEQRFAAAFAAKDIDAIMKIYAPDIFVFDVVPPRQYVGTAAYRKDWQQLFSGFVGPIKFELTDLVISTDGTIGYGHSIQHVSGVDPTGAKSEMTVRVTDVYRKIGGRWLVVQEHVSVPIDLDHGGKPDMMSTP
jgi:uncharacterized protein (TIGR02246 family)